MVQQQSRARRKARKIRYHDHEWNEIAAQARACGIPAATFIRRVSLGAKPRARRNRNENELILRLGSIATNLDSLARACHQGGRLPAATRLQLVLDEVLSAIRRIG
ncbi:MAG: plasmid mobilization protein [Geminicoccaceae bacterium]